MAVSIFDGPFGLQPASECKKYRKLRVAPDASDKIYKGWPVSISSGYAVPWVLGLKAEGVACHHVDATPGVETELIITDDYDMEFYALMDGAFTLSSDVNRWGPLVTAGGEAADHSEGVVDESALVATFPSTATVVVQVQGLATEIPNNASTYVANKTPIVRVKLVNFDHMVDTDT